MRSSSAADIGTMSRKDLVSCLRQMREEGHEVCALNARSEVMRETLLRHLHKGDSPADAASSAPCRISAASHGDLRKRPGRPGPSSPPKNAAAGERSMVRPGADGQADPTAGDCTSVAPTLGARSLFLRGFGAVYICAFASYWLQYPGCFGDNGLLPVNTYWQRVQASPELSSGLDDVAFKIPFPNGAETNLPFSSGLSRALRQWARFPCLLWLSDGTGIDTDVVMEGTALLGGLCGALAVVGCHHGSVFLLAFLCYLSLFVVGQTFLSFQWDIFLLETGASIVLYAPWFSFRAAGPNPAVAWLMRAQWVKFMVMSGTVKVTADCPTWRQLSALEFHFASTCLPTSEAWLHHSLPPFILRLGVAVMFLEELVCPWLLLAPIVAVRRIGVLCQLPLQVLIMLTGNYNWYAVQATNSLTLD